MQKKKIQNIPNREQEQEQPKTNQDRIQTMTGRGVKGNAQTKYTDTDYQTRNRKGRTQEKLKGHMRAWKIKT